MTTGTLYVVATPIGNLEDFNPRAQKILQDADLILAEDTRHSKILLQQFAINTPVKSFHEHNEEHVVAAILDDLKDGKNIALISDAGTPLINDPGYRLVSAAMSEQLKVVPIPGPSAITCALSVSGQPTDRFVYEGFLPAKKIARRNRLLQLTTEERTMVFYEVPHRISGCLEDMIEIFGTERIATIAKELTKYHETIRKDTLENLLEWLQQDDARTRGEFVLVVQGSGAHAVTESEQIRILEILLETLPVKQAAAVAAKILNTGRNPLYRMALKLKQPAE